MWNSLLYQGIPVILVISITERSRITWCVLLIQVKIRVRESMSSSSLLFIYELRIRLKHFISSWLLSHFSILSTNSSGGPLYDEAKKVLVCVVSWGYGCALPQYLVRQFSMFVHDFVFVHKKRKKSYYSPSFLIKPVQMKQCACPATCSVYAWSNKC